ncbi:MAG TPA: hypothetical protein VGJ20_40565 [Xanthobacteraceae bacterium]|jgi:hypothetical protein
MRAFLLACLAIIVVAAAGYFALTTFQRPSGAAFASDEARIDPDWSWRSVLRGTTMRTPERKAGMTIPAAPSELSDDCHVLAKWQWVFVDFGIAHGESETCEISQ